MSQDASSFSIELGQLSRCLSGSTEASLVLLDEVGKGCRADGECSLRYFCAWYLEADAVIKMELRCSARRSSNLWTEDRSAQL